MPISIIDNFTVNTTKNIDSRLGPYASVAQATGSISTLLRYVGMTITVTGSGQPVEYWFNPTTTDTDLVLKTASVTGFVTTSSFNAFTSSYNTGSFTGSFTGSLFGTSSWAISASNAQTASFVNPLNQTLVLTGSFNVSGSTTQIGTNNLVGQTNLSGSIIVSGTMQANANVTIGGTLRLDPAQDPGSTNATASFLFTSSSNTAQGYDLYYRQDGNIAKFKWLEGGISTGLLYGGVVSASGTTIYVSSGSGLIMTANASLSQEISPTFKYVTWNNYSASATYLTSSQNTYLYVDDTGVVRQQPNYFVETQYQEAICLGRATHANYTAITGVGSNVQTTYDSDAQQNDFIRAFGPLKTSGLTVTGQTNTLRLNIGAGQSYNLGGFYPQNPDHPSDYTSNAFLTASMARAHRSGSGIYLNNNGGAFFTVIDPTKYDDGSGVLQNTGTGNWTIQRVFVNPVSGRVTVYYGQTRYTTQINALQYLATDPFTEGEFTAKSLVFAGYLVLKGNTTDLTDTENTIIQSGIFRNTTGGSASTGTVTLSLDNLSDVTITTPTDGQALVYSSGTWLNGIPLNSTSSSRAISSSFASTASFAQGGNGSFSGSFSGSGANLNSIPTTAIVGNFTQIATGSVTASVTPTQFSVVSGSMTEFLVTGTGATLGGAITDTHRVTGSLLVTGSNTIIGNQTITGSLRVSSSNATQFLVGNQSLFVNSLGNVGIGTIAPSDSLEISSSLTASLRITGTGGSLITIARQGFPSQTGVIRYPGNYQIGTLGSDALQFLTNNAIRMTVQDSTGNVGIGTASPTSTLDVVGFTRITPTNAQLTARSSSLSLTGIGGATSGNTYVIANTTSFQPASGNGSYAGFYDGSTINPTLVNSNISRGLYINPTIQTVTDYRAIEFTNNSGFGIYQSGSAKNSLFGDLLLGTNNTGSTAAGKLQIIGSSATTGNALVVSNSTPSTILTVQNNGQVLITGSLSISGSFNLPLSQSTTPQTGSAYWSGSFLFIYNGARYMSASFF